jgi:hypothetical protein
MDRADTRQCSKYEEQEVVGDYEEKIIDDR